MSFEFEKPTCYSPNGLVFGVLREGHAYSAPCRTTADGPVDNRIIWYFVDSDTPEYDDISAFEPRVDNIYDLKHDTMEVSALKPCPRKHYSGRDIWYRDATGVIGDADDFAGRSRVGKCLCQNGPPHPPCVSGPHAFNEIGLGGRVKIPTLPRFLGKLKMASVFTKPLDLAARGKIALGGKMTYFPPPALELDGGLALGRKFVKSSNDPTKLAAGLGLGGVLKLLAPMANELAAGVGLGAVTTLTPPLDYVAGLGLGAVMTYTPTPAVELDAGLALGHVWTLTPGYPIGFRGGIALGFMVKLIYGDPFFLAAGLAMKSSLQNFSCVFFGTEGIGLAGSLTFIGSGSGSGPGGPGPGNSCDDGTLMDDGVDYTFDIGASAPDGWVKIFVPMGSSVDIAYRTNSGGDRSISWYHGDCDDLNIIRGTFEPLITFTAGPWGSSRYVIGFINNGSTSACNFTVRGTLV